MQHALAKRPDDAALLAAEARLLLDRRVSPFAKTNARDIEWRNGLLRSVRLHDTSSVARLLRHSAARFLRNVWLSESADLAAMLTEGPELPYLRQLVLGVRDSETVPFDLRKFPALEHLEIDANDVNLANLPALRRLYLRMPRSTSAFERVVSAPGHRLEELELWFGENGEFALDRVFQRDLPVLRAIRLGNASFGLVPSLAVSRFAAQLETIDLTQVWVGANMVADLVKARTRFPALKTLFAVPRDREAELRRAYGACLRIEQVERPFATWRT